MIPASTLAAWSDSEIAQLRDLERKATPGPWSAGVDGWDDPSSPYAGLNDGDYRGYVETGDVTIVRPGIANENHEADAAFIAAAREAVPALIAELERARAALNYIAESGNDCGWELSEYARRAVEASR